MLEHIRTLVIACWVAWHPGIEKTGNASEIADAIAQAVVGDSQEAVYETRELDAIVMAVYALRESWLRDGLAGDGGKSWGVWQQNELVGKQPIPVQARVWLRSLHSAAGFCRDVPSAPLAGGCLRARGEAKRREKKARELLSTVAAH